ncbi:NAD(P)(+) transhydrogenase (Re/Si-specific) subunit beta [Chloroflexi bacterium]|nr:NAD(P)(+) transhydrogenase (Re/Si-specific) subunit beta [Chloroflexota bacterium]RZP12864.1 MAG: NAD(P)(+) transhydrogenase (Re/Si-specific) subunit beta [Chloroflexota bacterium]
MSSNVENILYLISAAMFILGIKRLASPATARNGNRLSSVAMLIAIIVTVLKYTDTNIQWIILGLIIGSFFGLLLSKYVQMTAMPQLVAVFNAFGGAASAIVAMYEVIFQNSVDQSTFVLASVAFATIVGSVTFTGSFIAFGKLQELLTTKPILLPLRNFINIILIIAVLVLGVLLSIPEYSDVNYLYIMVGISLILGILIVIPIGGADMPVVVALLNSYSGIAGAGAGFVLGNPVLIISGSLVGASGLILTRIMTKAMNRSLLNVMLGGFGSEEGSSSSGEEETRPVTSLSPDDAAMILGYAESVIFVPGYGLAVAQAQHQINELSGLLKEKGVSVKFAIHPVAGRMPGHMNVLLAEANVPYDELKDLDEINSEFDRTDVAVVVGANDVTNPNARTDKSSPIYGMPILNVDKAKSVIVLKRSMASGFSGVQNELFFLDKTNMLFGDAKDSIEGMIKEVRELD